MNPSASPIDTAGVPNAVTPRANRWKTKRTWVSVVTGLLIVGGGVAAYAFRPQARVQVAPTPVAAAAQTVAPTPTPRLSLLTGLAVEPGLADRPITSVIIENHPDARPQSGLAQAGIVYEALAEGGITRFQAFFQDQRPAVIGPVRSLRTYFVDWGLEYGAPVAHAGGNADAMDLVGPLKMKDINALSFASSGFYRTTDRVAPHNLYTSSDKLDALMSRLGFAKPSTYVPGPRKPDSPTATAPHPNIHINYSYNGYQVDYAYDQSRNDYARTLAGTPHVDRNGGAQIHVKNVVVLYVPTSYGYTRTQEQTVIMQTVGTGRAVVMRDGQAVTGTWSKASHAARTVLTGDDGQEIALNAGNTWFSVVPTGNVVSY